MLVNDKHSHLNPTQVLKIVSPTTVEQLRQEVIGAEDSGCSISVAGGRHAMGGQQFGTDTVLVDMRSMRRIISLDSERGLCEVEAGIEWPELIDSLVSMQAGDEHPWTIAQKQTGANALTIGGALAANIHGRGLRMSPIAGDVESFNLVNARGEVVLCSRDNNRELFSLAIGGYGLFGIISTVTLRLARRIKLRRVVEIRDIGNLLEGFKDRVAAGFLYGDFQYATDMHSEDFLRKGVFSSYQPVEPDFVIPKERIHLTEDDWRHLVHLAHVYKSEAFESYARHYLSTSGQVYCSDLHQLAVYLDDYHDDLDIKLGSDTPATEVITEISIPRERLVDFLNEARNDFRRHNVDLIYGTIRLVEQDVDTYLRWATQAWACVIFNLHVEHSEAGRRTAGEAFSRLADMAIRYNGTFYLTYHRYASREQVAACYPMFADFLKLKLKYDPDERFQSDWYRHYRNEFLNEFPEA